MYAKVDRWMWGNSITLLRISMGIVYVWFGALKYFPQLSPADELAKQTIRLLTFGLIPDSTSILLLAVWETALGSLLLIGYWRRWVFYLLVVHLVCTFVPLFCFVELSFSHPPYGFTLVGQYIVKNIVFLSVALVLNGYYRKGSDR